MEKPVRVVFVAGSTQEVGLFLRCPTPVEGREFEWICEFRVEGLEVVDPGWREARGVDAYQAIGVALVGIRSVLEESGVRIEFLDEEGLWAFPRLEPMGLGGGFLRHVQHLIDAEVARVSSDPAILAAINSKYSPTE